MSGHLYLRTAAGGLALLALVACSNNPSNYEPLRQVQARLQQERQGNLPVLAPTAFAEAELALSRAERALGEVRLPEIQHLTTMADIRLATAQAQAQAAAARQERDQLLEQRRSLLAEARQRRLQTSATGEAGAEAALPPPPAGTPGLSEATPNRP